MRSPQQRRRDANQELSGVRQACSGLLRIKPDFALFLSCTYMHDKNAWVFSDMAKAQ